MGAMPNVILLIVTSSSLTCVFSLIWTALFDMSPVAIG